MESHFKPKSRPIDTPPPTIESATATEFPEKHGGTRVVHGSLANVEENEGICIGMMALPHLVPLFPPPDVPPFLPPDVPPAHERNIQFGLNS